MLRICFTFVDEGIPVVERENFRGVGANVLDCNIVVNEFESQSRHYIHVRTYAPWESYESFYVFPAMG